MNLCGARTVHTTATTRVSKRKQEEFFSLIKDRANGKPVSRIIKKRNFWNSVFCINSSTLDPRPDSEILVSSGIELAKIFIKKEINRLLNVM